MQPDALDALRSHIDAIDDELVDVLRRRMEISAEIGRYKHAAGMSVVQPVRYNSLIERRVAAGTAVGLDPDFMRRLFSTIHEESVRHQLKS
jgi:chorismate mutase